MAYFTSGQYAGKREYAAKVATDNKNILVNAGMTEDEADTLVELSHTRHNLHSSDSRSNELRNYYDELGHQYSADETLVDRANVIARKYSLPVIPSQEIPEVDIEDEYGMTLITSEPVRKKSKGTMLRALVNTMREFSLNGRKPRTKHHMILEYFSTTLIRSTAQTFLVLRHWMIKERSE